MHDQITAEAINITKKYGSRTLFSDISLAVKSGECLAITGANGSGKSTLLKVIAGIVRPSAGVVRIMDGGRVLDPEERLFYLGMVSPEIMMYENLTGCENISLLAQARGVSVGGQLAADYCRQVGLGMKGTELVKTYSTGMKQRLKFALLLAVNPAIWLLDEPSSNLDREGRELVADFIAGALKDRRAVILATNDEAEVAYAQQTIALS